MTTESFVTLVVGIALLAFGRKLFWLFVGAAGFLAGIHIATRIVDGHPGVLVLLIALAAGVIGAVLAIVLQKVAIAAAGFIIGGYVAVEFLRFLGTYPDSWSLLAFLVGGVLGAILVLALFDWALVILSSLGGATLVVKAVRPERPLYTLLFIILVIAGIVVQSGLMRRYPSRSRP